MRRRNTLGNESGMEPPEDLSWFGDQNPDRTGPSQCWPGVGVVCQSCHRRPEFLPHWLFLFFHWLTPLTWAVWLPFWLLSDLQNTGAAQDDGRLSWPIGGRMAEWTSIPFLLPFPCVEANSKLDCQGLLCSEPEEAVYQEVRQDGSCSLLFRRSAFSWTGALLSFSLIQVLHSNLPLITWSKSITAGRQRGLINIFTYSSSYGGSVQRFHWPLLWGRLPRTLVSQILNIGS